MPNLIKIKIKGKYYKCDHCTAIFEIDAQDNATELNYCPNCGGRNMNKDTINIFDLNDILEGH